MPNEAIAVPVAAPGKDAAGFLAYGLRDSQSRFYDRDRLQPLALALPVGAPVRYLALQCGSGHGLAIARLRG